MLSTRALIGSDNLMSLGAASRWSTIINAAAAFALAAFAAIFFMSLNVVWNPGYYGDLGLALDDSWLVADVVRGSPADKAGVRVGDQVDRPHSFRDQIVIQNAVAPRPGEVVTLPVTRNGQRSTLTLRARHLPPLSRIDAVGQVLLCFVVLVWFVVGVILVLLRPSRMTWGFYLAVIPIALASLSDRYLSYLSTEWELTLEIIEAIFTALGIVGLLVFFLRFPTDTPTGWRRTLDRSIPYVLVAVVGFNVAANLIFFFASPGPYLWFDRGWNGIVLALVGLGAASLLTTYFGARGQERYRLKWVIFGLICFFIAALGSISNFLQVLYGPQWLLNSLTLLYGVLPLTVAYAVIRHRVIDLRFVISRALVFGVIAAVIGIIILFLDWLFSTKLINSPAQTAVYAAIALLVGLSLNNARQRIGSLVDSLFFQRWYRTQEHVNVVRILIDRAVSQTELHEPLTMGIENAFSLTSTALFERLDDGGFMRVAAEGWPPGTLWHLLPGSVLVVRSARGSRAVDLEAIGWEEHGLPTGAARPVLVVPVAARKTTFALLLLGAHADGTGLDPDEVRSIRRLCADAARLYDRSTTRQDKATAVREQRRARAAP